MYKPMTHEQMERLITMTPDDVMKVYNGRAGRCCCGCAGTYRIHPSHVEQASKYRGYPYEPHEVNLTQVRRVLSILKANALIADCGENHYAVELGERLYIVYPAALCQPRQK